jgi:hypothetical protein
MPEWLEVELARSLAPVQAPEELWDRILDPRGCNAPRAARSAWSIAAIVTIMVTAWAFWFAARGEPVSATRSVAFSNHRQTEETCKLCHASL